MAKKKNPAAVALGRLGGLKRAKNRTPEERSEIARIASEAARKARKNMTPEERRKLARRAAKARWQEGPKDKKKQEQ